MRWIWIDRILELERATRCVAVKNVTLAEELLHDHFPADPEGVADARRAEPVFPNPLVIEGMAQTAGILVGHANDFQERVLLAKIRRASFVAVARPGQTIRYDAQVERIDQSGASTTGQVTLIDSATGQSQPMGEIELMFSHIDRAKGDLGLDLPDHNFVFTSQFMDLLYQSGHAPRPTSQA